MMRTPRRRRRRRTAAERLRPFWIVIVSMVLVASAGGYLFATWSGFHVHALKVSGNHVVSRDEIVARAEIVPEHNIWLQNTHAMAHRIETIPYVARAWVHRAFPDRIAIVVTERHPYATLFNAERALIDHDLRVLSTNAVDDDVPRIGVAKTVHFTPGVTLRDPSVRSLREDLDALLVAHVSVATLELDPYGDVVVKQRDGIRLLLGDDQAFTEKIALIVPILKKFAHSPRPITTIDLRAPSTPVVTLGKPLRAL